MKTKNPLTLFLQVLVLGVLLILVANTASSNMASKTQHSKRITFHRAVANSHNAHPQLERAVAYVHR
jgi:hypothetical protein